MAFCPRSTSATRHFWVICAGPTWRRLYKFSPSPSKLAIDLRVPSAFLFRGYAGANTVSWIDPRKLDEQTVVNLHLCCFGSRTFSPCTLVFQGCSREWLGNFAFEHNLRCHGRHGFCSLRSGDKHLETGLVSRVKKQDLPLRFQRSLVSVLMTAG